MRIKKLLSIALVLLLCTKMALVWYGFDRLPLLPNNDEAAINDPALFLSRGEGFAAKSLAGLLRLDEVFAHYPPVYPLLQALVYRSFGISGLTLRGSNIIFFTLYVCLLILIFSILRKKGFLDTWAFYWVSFLLLTDPTTFYFARMGRSDSLGIFFALFSLFLLFSTKDKIRKKWIWISSGCLIGLALATHYQMISLWMTYVCIVFGIHQKQERKDALSALAFSILTPIILLLIVLKTEFFTGIKQVWWIYSHYQTLGLAEKCGNIFEPFKAALSGNIQVFAQKGGSAFFVIILSWGLIFSRIVYPKQADTTLLPPNGKKLLLMMGIVSLLHFFMILLVDTFTQRIISIFPAALIALGFSLSHIRRHTVRYILNCLCAIFLVCGFIGQGYYLHKAHAEWDIRNPRRLEEFVQGIPRDKKVAAVFPFWLEFAKAHHKIRMLDTGAPGDLDALLDGPNAINSFDLVIIFDKGDSSYQTKILESLEKYNREKITIGLQKFIVLSKE